MALSVYFWPWVLFSSDAFTVFTLQLLFVIACNKLVKEDWIIAVILIEFFVMLFNVTFFCNTAITDAMHEQITLYALILELLIITASLQLGSASDDSRRDMVDDDDLWSHSHSIFARNRGGSLL
jgi:hypothetical protein